MRLHIFLLSTFAAVTLSRALKGPVEKQGINFTAEEWQAKWDAWHFTDASTLLREIRAHQHQNECSQADAEIAERDLLDVCRRIQGCAGLAAESAGAWFAAAAVASIQYCGDRANEAAQALAADDYRKAKAIVAYGFTEFVLPTFVTGPLGNFFFNIYTQNDAPETSKDDCGMAQPQAVSEQAGTATYGFCLQLQSVTQDRAFSRVDFGTVKTANIDELAGLDNKMAFYISSQYYANHQACQELGVWLKK